MATILLLLISIPLIEIYLFIKIGSYIGAFNTVSLILITAIMGIIYVRYEGFNTLRSGISQLIKKTIGIEKGSGTPLMRKVGKITKQQLKEIAQRKMPDLNTNDLEKAIKIVEGTAKAMGVEVE